MAPNEDGEGQRVELNAMTAPQFVAFLERKLTEHGAGKVVPEEFVLAEHAARILEREAAARWLATMPRTTIPAAPDGLAEQVRALLDADPTLAWDDAVALLLKGYPDLRACFPVPTWQCQAAARNAGDRRSRTTRSHAQRREHGEDGEHRTFPAESTEARSAPVGDLSPGSVDNSVGTPPRSV